MDKSKIIRKFEMFMFHGVPEKPESTYQRNNHANYTVRLTGESTNSMPLETDQEDGSILIGFVKDDFENEVQTFTPASIVKD